MIKNAKYAIQTMLECDKNQYQRNLNSDGWKKTAKKVDLKQIARSYMYLDVCV